MKKPLLLDLFCGAGGAAMGYHRAGFDVIGVDIEPQPNYPFEFIQADALEILRRGVPPTPWWKSLSPMAIHASPPCQASCNLSKGTNKGREYPQLIPPTRSLLAHFPGPTVMENVQGSKLRRDLTLCGEMFGLAVIRHRYFEINKALVLQPPHVPHRGRVAGYRHGIVYEGPYYAVYGDGGGKGDIEDWRRAMGIDWMQDKREIAESIPPAFTEYIGAQLIEAVKQAA